MNFWRRERERERENEWVSEWKSEWESEWANEVSEWVNMNELLFKEYTVMHCIYIEIHTYTHACKYTHARTNSNMYAILINANALVLKLNPLIRTRCHFQIACKSYLSHGRPILNFQARYTAGKSNLSIKKKKKKREKHVE